MVNCLAIIVVSSQSFSHVVVNSIFCFPLPHHNLIAYLSSCGHQHPRKQKTWVLLSFPGKCGCHRKDTSTPREGSVICCASVEQRQRDKQAKHSHHWQLRQSHIHKNTEGPWSQPLSGLFCSTWSLPVISQPAAKLFKRAHVWKHPNTADTMLCKTLSCAERGERKKNIGPLEWMNK